MRWTLHRTTRLALFALLGLAALLTGRSIAVFVAGALRPLPPIPAHVAPVPAPAGHRDADALHTGLARLFAPDAAAVSAAVAGGAARDTGTAPSSLVPSLHLIAVIAVEAAAGASWALARLGAAPTVLVLRPGDNVEGAQVVAVVWREVVLERDGRRERLHLFDRRPAPPAPADRSSRPTWYRSLGSGRFAVSRQGLEQAMRRMPFWQYPRVTFANGNVRGLRLLRIPSRAPWKDLDLRPGDTLIAVNGLTLHSPDVILGAYQQLRAAPRLEVVIARGGRRLRRTVLITE